MHLDRRTALVLATGALLAAPAAKAQTAKEASGSFTLPKLPYGDDALAPVIDAKTIGLHHGKHHAAYVKGLNDAIAGRPDLAGLSLEALMARMSKLPDAIRNNAGQHYAHSLYWDVMAPAGKGGVPSPALMAAIDRDLGGLDRMKAAFEKAGTTRFGSGWAWLIVQPDGKLAITSTPNADTPLMDDAKVPGQPLLVNDVWEHAYYLVWNNRRADYLAAWWQIVNWEAVSKAFAGLGRA